jgi:hypothetical protein
MTNEKFPKELNTGGGRPLNPKPPKKGEGIATWEPSFKFGGGLDSGKSRSQNPKTTKGQGIQTANMDAKFGKNLDAPDRQHNPKPVKPGSPG